MYQSFLKVERVAPALTGVEVIPPSWVQGMRLVWMGVPEQTSFSDVDHVRNAADEGSKGSNKTLQVGSRYSWYFVH